MREKEKERCKKDDSQRQRKKPYKIPRLIVHGTLEEITKSPKNVGSSDGAGTKSH